MASRAVKAKARGRAQVQSEQRKSIDAKFRERHPSVAAEQRALRKAQAQLHDDWRHKRAATPETLEKAHRLQQSTLSRMFMAGNIDADQLAWADEIRRVYERITGDARIGTASYETRVDQSARIGGAFFEKLGVVRAEVAYTAWRASLPKPEAVFAMIVEDLSCRAAEQRCRLRNGSARKLLVDALDSWPRYQRDACRAVDEATLLAAQAAIF
jgi:hypothetical protein